MTALVFSSDPDEWFHGGDVREALGEPGPHESEGVEDALLLLVDRSRRRTLPPTLVRLPDRELRLGARLRGLLRRLRRT
jgi:hypothetical protein